MLRTAYGLMLCGLSWLLMQVVHEAGHALAAVLVGADLQRVVLHPLTISRTDMADDPWPLLTIWAGPVVGAILPLAGGGLAGRCRSPIDHCLRFFAGFCLIANGAYLGYGAFEGIGDAGELLRHGAPRAALWWFGVISGTAGLWVWHRLGRRLGFGEASLSLTPRVVLWLGTTLLAIVVLECSLSPR